MLMTEEVAFIGVTRVAVANISYETACDKLAKKHSGVFDSLVGDGIMAPLNDDVRDLLVQVRIQRWWRVLYSGKRTTSYLTHNYRQFDVNEEIVTSVHVVLWAYTLWW